jgi:hypothetical protein
MFAAPKFQAEIATADRMKKRDKMGRFLHYRRAATELQSRH